MKNLLDRLPYKPYCTNNLNEGLKILPLSLAIKCKYLQLNTKAQKIFIIFDVDYEGAGASWIDGELPQPSFTVVNPVNSHAHIIYTLKEPVCTSLRGREEPQRYMRAIEDAYIQRLGADLNYVGLIAKNPWSPYWGTIDGNTVYDLKELADYVELSSVRRVYEKAEGRNCSLFEVLRLWAYKAIAEYWAPGGEGAWLARCEAEAAGLNTFVPPLPPREARAVARSVARWTWRHIKPGGHTFTADYIERTHTPEIQRKRAKKRWGESKQAEGLWLIGEGRQVGEVATLLGVDRRTVGRWLKGML